MPEQALETDWRIPTTYSRQLVGKRGEHAATRAEITFEHRAPDLQVGLRYSSYMRARNMEMELPWPEEKWSTVVAPPHPVNSEVFRLFPMSDKVLEVEWEPFRTGDPGLELVDYCGMAIAEADEGPHNDVAGVERVVASFVSDGSAEREVASVACLQKIGRYFFATEARYPYSGTRQVARALFSDKFCSSIVDSTLPAPQPLTVEASPMRAGVIGAGPPLSGCMQDCASALLVQWLYSADLTSKLTLQHRAATLDYPPDGSPRLQTSACPQLHLGENIRARLSTGGSPNEIRILQNPALQEKFAVQLRVVMVHENVTSPPSCWVHARFPKPPEAVRFRLICDDMHGIALRLKWQGAICEWARGRSAGVDGKDGMAQEQQLEMSPVTYAVYQDFSTRSPVERPLAKLNTVPAEVALRHEEQGHPRRMGGATRPNASAALL